jgi:hypothetical protein
VRRSIARSRAIPAHFYEAKDAFRRFWLELPRAFWPYPLNASMRLSKLTPALSKLMPTTSDLCKASIGGNVCGRCCSFFAVRRVAEALLHPVAFVFLQAFHGNRSRSVGWNYSDDPAQFVCVPGARNARCRNLARRSSRNLCSYAFLHDFEQNRSIHFRCTIKPS